MFEPRRGPRERKRRVKTQLREPVPSRAVRAVRCAHMLSGSQPRAPGATMSVTHFGYDAVGRRNLTRLKVGGARRRYRIRGAPSQRAPIPLLRRARPRPLSPAVSNEEDVGDRRRASGSGLRRLPCQSAAAPTTKPAAPAAAPAVGAPAGVANEIEKRAKARESVKLSGVSAVKRLHRPQLRAESLNTRRWPRPILTSWHTLSVFESPRLQTASRWTPGARPASPSLAVSARRRGGCRGIPARREHVQRATLFLGLPQPRNVGPHRRRGRHLRSGRGEQGGV